MFVVLFLLLHSLLFYLCRFIGGKLKVIIERVGPEKVFAVIPDGGSDWQATKTMIQALWPWISFHHCTSHGTSLVVKDCFKEDGDVPELFELNEWISEAQHWFQKHACQAFISQLAGPGDKTVFLWPACTRFCGVLLKIKRFRAMRDLLRRVVQSGVYVEKHYVDDEFKPEVESADVWDAMDRVTKTLGPLLLLCRLADGQKAVMSKLYGTMLYVRQKIEDVAAETDPDSVERRMCAVFLNRWPKMQSDIAQATYCLEPLFVDTSKTAASCTVKLWQLARKVRPPPLPIFSSNPTPPPPSGHDGGGRRRMECTSRKDGCAANQISVKRRQPSTYVLPCRVGQPV